MNVTLQMFNFGGTAANYHGAANSGVAGLTNGNRALDFSSNTGQGGNGPIAATTNASLGFGNVTNFVVTMWFKQSALMASGANIGPRMFVLGNSTNIDCGTANSIGMKFQDNSDLWFYVNTIQATASFGSSLPANTWIFVAMAYDGMNVTLYEGTDLTPATLISTTAAAGQTVPFGGNASLDIGNRLDRKRDFAGWIDDFRFYIGSGDSGFVESVRLLAANPPTGLMAAAGSSEVTLTWTALNGATSYNVKRSTTSGGPYTTISTAGNVTGTSFTDSTAVNGTTYYYVFSAATPYGESVNSAEVSAAAAGCTPPATPTAGYNSPLYAGMTLNLTASTVAGATYSWTGPNGFTSTSQNPSIPGATTADSGDYSVTATVGACTSAPGTTTVTVNPPASVSVQALSGSLILDWPFGTLQSATNLSGPWNSLTGVTPPYTNTPGEAQEFFRIRLQ